MHGFKEFIMNKEQNDITIIAFFGSSIETSVIEHAYILKSRTSCWRVSLAPTTSTSVKYTYDYVVLVFASSIHDNEYTEKSFACQDFKAMFPIGLFTSCRAPYTSAFV